MREYFENWKRELHEHKYLILISILILICAGIINISAGTYVDQANTSPVNDIILDNIPTINLEPLFSWGAILFFFVLLLYLLFFNVKRFHSAAFAFSVLILVRSFFIVLTHLGKPIDAVELGSLPGIYKIFNFHNDLFFSGHAAMPFMAFLLFRNEKIAWFFLLTTMVMSITVLAMHLHYSIDVFAAFFITYAIYTFSNWFDGWFKEKYFSER